MSVMDKAEDVGAPAPILLKSAQMAEFAAKGLLRMDAVVPDAVNRRFLEDIGHVDEDDIKSVAEHFGRIQSSSAIPVVKPGTALRDAYPEGSALDELMAVPEVAGAVASLVGDDCVLDHHFLHVPFPPRFFTERHSPKPGDSERTRQRECTRRKI